MRVSTRKPRHSTTVAERRRPQTRVDLPAIANLAVEGVRR